jgi:hypothetical protein
VALTAEERSLRARAGAYAQHAKHDVRETTKPARDAFLAKFESEVDPEGVLPEDERHRRAVAARKAHMATLALKSARARRRRAQ